MGKILRSFTNLLLLTALLFGFTRQAQAQEGIEFADVRVAHRFGEEVQFSAQIKAANPIQEILLVFRDINEENTASFLSLQMKKGALAIFTMPAKTCSAPLRRFLFGFR